jgi:hypothetical protein
MNPWRNRPLAGAGRRPEPRLGNPVSSPLKILAIAPPGHKGRSGRRPSDHLDRRDRQKIKNLIKLPIIRKKVPNSLIFGTYPNPPRSRVV